MLHPVQGPWDLLKNPKILHEVPTPRRLKFPHQHLHVNRFSLNVSVDQISVLELYSIPKAGLMSFFCNPNASITCF